MLDFVLTSKFKVKMAPISEKRTQPEVYVKENGHQYVHPHGHGHTHTHSKENASARHSKKGLEILDFHESWLEEMEIYKDRMYGHKLYQRQSGSNEQRQSAEKFPIDSEMFVSLSKNIKAIMNAASGQEPLVTSTSTNTSTKRASEQQQGAKTRMVRNAAAAATPPAAAATASADQKQTGQVNLLLKRPRDEHTASKKRHTRSRSQPQVHLITNSYPPSIQGQNTTRGGSGTTTPPNGSHANKPTTKIIVNQFHASSLLSAHQHEEKTKILTQNGLTKSAANAYEASLYASKYLPQDNYKGTSHGASHISGDHNNYTGVTLIKGEYGHHKMMSDDDPCAAIDDVNDYTDSDSEEEYTGSPFYLDEDGNQTHQSLNIRYYQSEPPTSQLSGTDETETDRSEYYKPTSILSPSIFPNVPPYLNFSSHVDKGPHMPSALHKVLKWKLSPVMPKIVKRVVLNSGFRIIKNTTDWMAIWEKHMKSPGFRTIRSHQKYNHMPGSFRIGRKDSMWRSIYNNQKKFGTKEFGFMQKSYVMPDDLENLRQVWPKNASKLTKWIVKPPASARGTGIRIINKWSQFPKDRPLVVQKYIERPLLINDNKFDMRIYVVVMSINPLRIYMYKDGLARFASVKYSSELNSLDDRCMHLTNYSINKFSQNYSKNEDFNACQGHKWTLQSLWSCLEKRGVNTKRLWATLRNLVIKAIVSGESGLNRMYRQNVNFRYNCFELFGFDVLLDENLIPWLLEINISPSLHSELPLDLHVKGPLIQATLNTALYQVPPKLNDQQQQQILGELGMKGNLCYDKRIFTTCLTAEEVRKHNHFTSKSIEFREEYLDAILDNLMPDDIRCLIISEDEYARSKPLERVFPTPETHPYLKFIDNPRYYNRLLDAWEHKYGHCREKGLALLTKYCKDSYHLRVSDAALEKEPNVALTEIDMLHSKKSDDTLVVGSGDNAGNNSTTSTKAVPKNINIESLIHIISANEVPDRSSKPLKDQTSAKNITVKSN